MPHTKTYRFLFPVDHVKEFFFFKGWRNIRLLSFLLMEKKWIDHLKRDRKSYQTNELPDRALVISINASLKIKFWKMAFKNYAPAYFPGAHLA